MDDPVDEELAALGRLVEELRGRLAPGADPVWLDPDWRVAATALVDAWDGTRPGATWADMDALIEVVNGHLQRLLAESQAVRRAQFSGATPIPPPS